MNDPKLPRLPLGTYATNFYDFDLVYTKEQMHQYAITALSARASAGEGGHVGNEWADMAANGVQWLRNIRDGISTADEALAEMESNARRITALTAAPQPAQAGASGGGGALFGYVSAHHVMDMARDGGVHCKAAEDYAHSVPVYLAPASPATGGDPCIECGADPGEACYPNCCTQTPQPAAASEWVMVPRKLTNAMQIAGLTALDESDATPESIGHLIGYKAIRESYAAMLAAAPQPQEVQRPSADWYRRKIMQGDGVEAMAGPLPTFHVCSNPSARHRHGADPMGHCPDCVAQGLGNWSCTPESPTPPAHGDGEGDAIAPWPDFAGNQIRDRDRIRHPDGTTGTVLRLADLADGAEGEAWRVVYGGGDMSRLSLQIGDKGQAVVVTTRPTPEAQEARDGLEELRALMSEVVSDREDALVSFFRTTGSAMGRYGDAMGWTPEQTARHFLAIGEKR